nr:hypothetical protein CFP56_27898 [Quercus suber]
MNIKFCGAIDSIFSHSLGFYISFLATRYAFVATRYAISMFIYVESNVEMLLQCQPGSEIYNQLTKTLDLVGELNRVALDNAHAMASEATIQATSHGGRGGGFGGCGRSRGRGGHGGGPDDEDDLDDEALEADWDTYMDSVGSSRCMSDATAQASHPVGHDDSAEHTSHAQAHPRSPLPTLLSPPLFSGFTHKGGCIFVSTPGRPTPPVV